MRKADGVNSRLLRDLPCAVCSDTPTRLIRERIPGSTGTMAQSFAGQYRLCTFCFARAEIGGAVQAVKTRTKREELTTVLARTITWLKATHKERKQ